VKKKYNQTNENSYVEFTDCGYRGVQLENHLAILGISGVTQTNSCFI